MSVHFKLIQRLETKSFSRNAHVRMYVGKTHIYTTSYVFSIHIIIQVCNILEGVSLGQYKELFLSEQIDGLLLLELDGDILSTELGVTKRLHRLKLQRVIEGRESIITHMQL